jgi:Asp-tRNA(Asn)/Glu-tRNA(Gln) amidotransferase A subunit family amidase
MLDTAFARIEAVDSQINALPILCFERAREQVRNLKKPNSPEAGYLFGLPITVKTKMMWEEFAPPMGLQSTGIMFQVFLTFR